MAGKEHKYAIEIEWTGNLGAGSADYRAYSRNHEIRGAGKPPIPGSSDPSFRGDSARYNPEELLVAAASTCHMLWYLHLCADSGIVVTNYVDNAEGVMREGGGGGRFVSILLRPAVTVRRGGDLDKARLLHEEANRLCFVANSLNFAVTHQADVRIEA